MSVFSLDKYPDFIVKMNQSCAIFGGVMEAFHSVKMMEDRINQIHQNDKKIIILARKELNLTLQEAAKKIHIAPQLLKEMESPSGCFTHRDYVDIWMGYIDIYFEKNDCPNL